MNWINHWVKIDKSLKCPPSLPIKIHIKTIQDIENFSLNMCLDVGGLLKIDLRRDIEVNDLVTKGRDWFGLETDGWTFFYMHLIFKWLSLLVGLVLFEFFFHPYSPQINDYDYDLDQDYCLVNGPKREYLRNRIDRTTNIKNYYIKTFF